MSQETQVVRFRPERPIVLNKENTGKSEMEVLAAVEKLRARGWLCVANEKIQAKPFHLSFNDISLLPAFTKDCNTIGIQIKAPLIITDTEETEDEKPSEATATATIEDPKGRIFVEKPASK